MKKELVKISDDVLDPKNHFDYYRNCPKKPGNYREQNDKIQHGIYLRNYKKTIEKLIINNGYLMTKYKYPIIETHFHSPLLNDYNLHLCGGWQFGNIRDEEIISRVINGLKPMGFYVESEDKTEKFQSQLELARNSKLPYVMNRLDDEYEYKGKIHYSTRYEIGISCNGTFNEKFNIDDLIHDYKLYSEKCYKYSDYNGYIKYIVDFLESLRDKEIKEFLNFDYPNPKTDLDLILDGLILGFPVETTVSRLWLY